MASDDGQGTSETPKRWKYQKKHKVNLDAPRYADAPVVVADEEGNITVVRGEFELTESFLGDRLLGREVRRRPGVRHVVIRSRLGEIRVLSEGSLEATDPDWDHRYLAQWYLSLEDLPEVRTFDEARAALQAKRDELDRLEDRIDRLEADGWELFEMEPGYMALRDTRRPPYDPTGRTRQGPRGSDVAGPAGTTTIDERLSVRRSPSARHTGNPLLPASAQFLPGGVVRDLIPDVTQSSDALLQRPVAAGRLVFLGADPRCVPAPASTPARSPCREPGRRSYSQLSPTDFIGHSLWR